jgi:8-oxo-dGTP diphosphatase
VEALDRRIAFDYRVPMILVTAGLIGDGDRLLVCQRRAGGAHPLEWEFPGGKVEPGESPERCLRRELQEELGIDADVGPELCRADHRYDGGPEVRLLFFRIRAYRGTPANRAFERIAWVRRADLAPEDFLAADRELVRRLRDGEVEP